MGLIFVFFLGFSEWTLGQAVGASSQMNQVRGRISIIGDTVHLELSGRRHWDYDVRRVEDLKIQAMVPPLDGPTIVQLNTFRGMHVNSIEVDTEGPDGSHLVTFHLSEAAVEIFDYLTDEPSRLIMDFYRPMEVVQQPVAQEPPSQTSKEPRVSEKAPMPVKESGQLVEGEYQRIDSEVTEESVGSGRTPAMAEFLSGEEDPALLENAMGGQQRGVFDGGDRDFLRFRVKEYEVNPDAVIASRSNIYIRFPLLMMPASRLRHLAQDRPEFEIIPKETRENREARLLLALYQRGRLATFLKTFEYFNDRYPSSDYDEIVKNLAAELHLSQWLQNGQRRDFDQARQLYTYLLHRYPNSPLAERTELILAYGSLEMEDGLRALQRLVDFLKKHPESEETDSVRRALAEVHLSLNQFEEAEEVYRQMVQSARSPSSAVEAKYRLGDIHFLQRDYDQAIKAYQKALLEHPEFEDIFPNAHFNKGEALFWQAQHLRSLDHLVEFLKRFPAHSHGGYAMTRIGEIMDILGVDKSRVMGAFLESHFRYRGHPGAELARIRMLSQRMRGMREAELNQALTEMLEIAERSPLPRAPEFVTLLIADGFQARGEHQRAMQYLTAYYQRHPTTTNQEFFRQRVAAAFSDAILDLVSENQFLESLKLHSQYSRNWLRNSTRTDIPYLIGRAYEQAGVFDQAASLYEKVLKELKGIAGTEMEREKRVNENLPSIDTLKLRLAKTAWEQRQFARAAHHLSALGPENALSGQEQLERAELAARLAEERGLVGEAIAGLEWVRSNWKGPQEERSRLDLELARLYKQTKDYKRGAKIVESLVQGPQTQNSQASENLAAALRLQGDILFKKGQKIAALESYTRLLEEFSSHTSLADVRFRAGNILYDLGDIRGAEQIWQALDSQKDSIYRSLADERLQHSQWSEEYQRYINRIPAMVE